MNVIIGIIIIITLILNLTMIAMVGTEQKRRDKYDDDDASQRIR